MVASSSSKALTEYRPCLFLLPAGGASVHLLRTVTGEKKSSSDYNVNNCTCVLSEAGRGVQHISLLRDPCSHEIGMLTVFLFKTGLSYWLCLHLDKHKDERSKE